MKKPVHKHLIIRAECNNTPTDQYVVEKWMRELSSLSCSLKKRYRHYWIRLLTNSGRLVQDREFDLSLETKPIS